MGFNSGFKGLICYEFRSGRAGYNAAIVVFKKANFCMFTTWRRVREWRCSSVSLNLSTSCRPMKSFTLRLFLPLLKETHYQLHRWLCVLHSRCGFLKSQLLFSSSQLYPCSYLSVISHLPQMCYNLRVFHTPLPSSLYFIPPSVLCTGINLPNIGRKFVSI